LGGEQPILAAHRAAPPDLTSLVHRDTSEHGATCFGRDFAQAPLARIGENHQVTGLIGARVVQSSDFARGGLTARA